MLALVMVPGALAAHPMKDAPTSNTGVTSCQGCHDGAGGGGGFVCTDCHVYPTFSLSVTAAPTSVPALSSSDVTLTVGKINTVRESGYSGLTSVFSPVNGAAVSLSGAGVSTSGTTDAAGIVTKSVNPTGAGTIGVTASLIGYTSGTSSVTSNAASDNTPPVITMLGSTPIDIVVGSVYVDAGATASDNKDGSLTSSIVTVNSVNTAITGSYTVTYNVVDAAGNHAVEVVRTVNVVAVEHQLIL